MNIYTFNKEEKTIKIYKDCKKCIHINVCTFHKKTNEFSRHNDMYSMNEYAEHNNILRVFELHASCSHYVSKFNDVAGESPTLESHPGLITELLYDDVSLTQKKILTDKYPEHKDNLFFFFQPDVKKDIKNNTFTVVLKTTNKEIGHGTIVWEETKTITEILNDWKFVK